MDTQIGKRANVRDFRTFALFIFIALVCIFFVGGDFMQNSTLILTEQHQPNDESPISDLIQQAITAWLTKELSK